MNTPWRTSTVGELCQGMREAQDYSACPILADALQDADYSDAAVLAQLRASDAPQWERERAVARVYSAESSEAVAWLEWARVDLRDAHGGHAPEDPVGHSAHQRWRFALGRFCGHSSNSFWDGHLH